MQWVMPHASRRWGHVKTPPVIGPGHQTFVEIDGQTWIVYHAWEVTPQGLKTDWRFMWLDRLEWEADAPVIQGPTTGIQPVPIPGEPSE